MILFVKVLNQKMFPTLEILCFYISHILVNLKYKCLYVCYLKLTFSRINHLNRFSIEIGNTKSISLVWVRNNIILFASPVKGQKVFYDACSKLNVTITLLYPNIVNIVVFYYNSSQNRYGNNQYRHVDRVKWNMRPYKHYLLENFYN